MSYARKLGAKIRDLSTDESIQAQICTELQITTHELQKLYSGRLFLTGKDLEVVARICGVSSEFLVRDSFSDELNETAMDIIDAYIDAKESLEEICS